MEQKKKKSCVEEGVNAENSEEKEETTDDMSIPMDNDRPGIDPYIKVIPPNMVLTYASDDDRNSKSDSDIDYEPKDDDDDVLGAKELPGGTYIYNTPPNQRFCLLQDWDKLNMK